MDDVPEHFVTFSTAVGNGITGVRGIQVGVLHVSTSGDYCVLMDFGFGRGGILQASSSAEPEAVPIRASSIVCTVGSYFLVWSTTDRLCMGWVHSACIYHYDHLHACMVRMAAGAAVVLPV